MSKDQKAVVVYVTKEEKQKLDQLSSMTGLTRSALLGILLNSAHDKVTTYLKEEAAK